MNTFAATIIVAVVVSLLLLRRRLLLFSSTLRVRDLTVFGPSPGRQKQPYIIRGPAAAAEPKEGSPIRSRSIPKAFEDDENIPTQEQIQKNAEKSPAFTSASRSVALAAKSPAARTAPPAQASHTSITDALTPSINLEPTDVLRSTSLEARMSQKPSTAASSSSSSSSSRLMPPPPRPPPVSSSLRPSPGASLLPNRGPAAMPSSSSRGGPQQLLSPNAAIAGSGNPRQKVVLQPGHSPLDWAALIQSGKNLSGVERLQKVTPSQLAYHNGRKGRPAWSSWQAKVYNITPYLPFHPGGEDQLRRAAGKAADKLFMEVHPWVNWENMLGECLVGILVSDEQPQRRTTSDDSQQRVSSSLDDMD